MKLESQVQASIMTRYFWYQLINVYVTVGFGGVQIVTQIFMILKNPQLLVNFAGQVGAIAVAVAVADVHMCICCICACCLRHCVVDSFRHFTRRWCSRVVV